MKIKILITILFMQLVCFCNVYSSDLNEENPTKENKLISLNKSISRVGDVLSIKCKEKELHYTDNLAEDESYIKYSFDNVYEQENTKHYLIGVAHYEWTTYLLINSISGEVVELLSEPIFSKSYKRFVDANIDLYQNMTENNLCIYKTEENKYTKEYERNYDEIEQKIKGPAKVVWDSETSITVYEDSLNEDSEIYKTTAKLTLDKKWEYKKF